MIDFAILHKEKTKELLMNEYKENRNGFIGFTGCSYISESILNGYFPSDDWGEVSIVSIFKEKIIGLIYFNLIREHNRGSMSMIKFKEDASYTRAFYRDIISSINKMYDEYDVRNISITCLGFNTRAKKIYEKMCKKGLLTFVGKKSNQFTLNNISYDSFLYEINKKQMLLWKGLK